MNNIVIIYVYISPVQFLNSNYFNDIQNYNELYSNKLCNVFADRKIPDYINITLTQSRYTNKNARIILISDDDKLTDNIKLCIKQQNIEYHSINEFDLSLVQKHSDCFCKNTYFSQRSKDLSGCYLFMLVTFLRFSICEVVANRLNIQKFLFCENDNLIYEDIEDVFKKEKNIIIFPGMHCSKGNDASSGIFYIDNLNNLTQLNQIVLFDKLYSYERYMTDMKLPVIINKFCKDNSIKINLKISDNLPNYSNFLIDPLVYGQYLSNVTTNVKTFEQFNKENPLKDIWINFLKPNIDKISFYKKSNHFIMNFNNREIKFINLHIHNKKFLKEFKTYE